MNIEMQEGQEKKIMTQDEFMMYVKLREKQEEDKKEWERIKSVIGDGYDEFWHSKERYRVVKGGRGSKKSTTTALYITDFLKKNPLANCMVIRNTFNTHKDSTYAQLKWATHKWGDSNDWKFTVNPLEAVYVPNGNKIIFRGFDEILKLTSVTVEKGVLNLVWLEEAFEIDDVADFDTLDESIRGEMPDGYWKSIIITYNPWISSHWTKERFWDNEYPNTFKLTTTHKCNEWLDEADHKKIEDLQYTDPERYRVVGLGEYGIPGGAYFDEFRREIHVCKPFVIPRHWNRYTAMDYGLDMLAHYWIAVDPNNNAYVYKELHEPNLVISDACRKITQLENETVISRFAPPDLWNRRQETGKSAADIFRENGLPLHKVSNKRVQGWYNLKEWLRPQEVTNEQTGEKKMSARLKIFENCTNLIHCLPQLQRSDKDPNDVATEPHNITHAPDALRTFTSSRPCPDQILIDTVVDMEDEDEDDIQSSGYNSFFC